MGLIAYSNKAKSNLLKITKNHLKKYGAVSHETAYLMVKNLKKLTNSKLCISTTGIAGPSGGTKENINWATYTADVYKIAILKFPELILECLEA
mgnify:CR=1 FL=1